MARKIILFFILFNALSALAWSVPGKSRSAEPGKLQRSEPGKLQRSEPGKLQRSEPGNTRNILLETPGNQMSGEPRNSESGEPLTFARLTKRLLIPTGSAFLPQGPKLVDLSVSGTEFQGWSTSISSDGNTAIVGGYGVDGNIGAGWVYTRTAGVWTLAAKLVGTNVIGSSEQGGSVAISADGLTAAVGGFNDNGGVGAVWVFTSSGGIWSQQGSKLTGNDAIGTSSQGRGVALSADGSTLLAGGSYDNSHQGAAWVYTRSNGVWTQQGSKLTGTGSSGTDVYQGCSVTLSADGNSALVGAYGDASNVGAAWQYYRTGSSWAQVGSKITASDETGAGEFGYSVSMSANASTSVIGATNDNGMIGAAWIFSSAAAGAGFTQSAAKHVGTGIGTATPSISYQGCAVSISSDGSTVAVGGWGDQNFAGAIWIYTGSGGVWTQMGQKVDTAGTSNLGKALALSSDGMTIIAGEPNDISGSTYYGASIVFAVPYITPTVQATNLVFTSTATTSSTVSWTNGNGSTRLVFIYQGNSPSPVTPLPLNSTTYTAGSVYAAGTQIGTTGWYCIYNGTGSTVALTGLTQGTAYQLMTQEYNGMTGTQKYLTIAAVGNPASVTTPTPTITVSGSLNSLSTYYGSASSQDSFYVSGNTLTAGITATAPAGYQVSTSSHGGFASSIVIGAAGAIASTKVYIRLSGTTNASTTPYTGSVTLTSTGAPSTSSAPISGIVNPLPINITAINGPLKSYGQVLATALVTGSLTEVNGDYVTGVTETPDAPAMSATLSVGSAFSVMPSQATGNASFLTSNYAITYAAYHGTVTPAALVITATNTTRTYGSVLTGGAGSTAFTSATLMNGETIGSVTMAYSTGNNTTDGVGTYANSPTASAATGGTFTASNYTISYVQGTMTVTTAPLTITGNTAKVYGTVLTGGTGSYSFTPVGLMNGETINTVTIGYGTGAAGTDAVGTYNATATPSAATGGTFNMANYSPTYKAGIILVIAKPLYITAINYTKSYGTGISSGTGFTGINPVGLQNNETIGSVTMTFGTGAAATAGAGTYSGQETPSAATGGTFSMTNYTPYYYTASIIVSRQLLNISASTVSKQYGTVLNGASGQLGFSTSGLVNGETVGTVTLAYGSGSAATDVGGTYTSSITPSLLTGGTFNAANYQVSYSQADLLVFQAAVTITVTANATTKIYGNVLTGGSGSVSFTPQGLQNGETIGSITISYGAGASATAAAGTYTGSVTGSAATGGTFQSGNYTINYVVSDLTVTPRILTLTANDVVKTYGSGISGGSGSTLFTSSGLQNGDGMATVSLTDGTGSAATAAAGIYTGTVVPSLAVGSGTYLASNYTPVYVAGKITVGTSPLVITPSEVDKTYGTALTGGAGFTTFTPSGLLNGESVGSITLAYGTGSASTDAVGTYLASVTASLATGGTFTASNYSITYAQAKTVVAPSVLTITANGVSKTYGTAVTGATGSGAFTYTGLQNSESIGSITIAYGTGATAASAAGIYTGSVTGSAATGGSFNSANYSIIYDAGDLLVAPKTLILSANFTQKTYGTTLTGGSGHTDFTTFGLVSGDQVASLTVEYGFGSASTDPAGTYPGAVIPSLPVGSGTFIASNYHLLYAPNEIQVTAIPLVITASEVDKTYGTTLTGGTGFTTFSSSGLVNGETVGSVKLAYGTGSASTDAVGTYTASVTASQATGGTFYASNYSISYVKASIVVAQTALVITANTFSKIYGTAITGAAGSGAFTSAGLQNGETTGSVTIGYGTGSAVSDPAGTYSGSVTASNAVGGTFTASNYLISYTAGILTVSKKNLIITATAVSKIYGTTLTGSSGQAAFTSAGLVSGEALSSVTLAYGAGATANSSVATYPGSVSPGSPVGNTNFNALNYSISYVSSALTVTTAPLTITAVAATKFYGSTLTGSAGSSAFTSSGLLNGESIGSVTISYGASAAPATAAGVYAGAVTPGSATGGTFSVGNYAIIYSPATLTVSPALLNISAVAVTKNYGASLSAGSGSSAYTSSGLQNNETAGTVTLAYGSGSATTAAVGTYAGSVTVTGLTGGTFTASNYAISYAPADLTVGKVVLVISTGSVSKVYGSVLTGSAGFTAFSQSGLQNSETIGSITTDYGTGSAATAPVGTYAGSSGSSLAVGGSFNPANYSISYATSTIVVTQAPLTITATGPSKVYGSALAAAISSTNFTSSTLMNGEAVTSVVLTPDNAGLTFNTNAGLNYSVVPSAASGGGSFLASNYSITYIPFTGTVSRALLSITAGVPLKTYGSVLASTSLSASFSTTPMAAGESIIGVTLNADAVGQSGTAPAGATYTLTPSAASGNAAFKPANYTITYISSSGQVIPAPLIISAISASKTYGAKLNANSVSAAFTFSALQNNESIGTVSLSYTAGASATAPVSVYPLAIVIGSAGGGTFAASNYAISYVAATLTVTPAALTITSLGIRKVYGSVITSAPGFTDFSYTGLQNNEIIGSVSSVIGTGGAATAAVGIYTGSSAVTAATGGTFLASNYSISYLPGDIQVSRAVLSILADDAAKTYGSILYGTDGSSSFTPSGLQNGETLGSVTITYGTGSAAVAAAGTYAGSVTPSQATGGSMNAGNYNFVYYPGNIIVSPAALVVTVLPVQKQYGVLLTAVSGSSAFTYSALQNSETAGTISIAYGAGAAAAALAGTYPGSAVGSLLSGGSFNRSNYLISYIAAPVIVGTGQPALLVVSQPGCASAFGVVTIQNYNEAYAYSLSLSASPGTFIPAGSFTRSGNTISALAGSYTLTALAPASFTSPASQTFTINPRPPIPNLVISNPLEVNAPATVNIKAAAITALSDPGLTLTYFKDSYGTVALAGPEVISVSGVYYIQAINSSGCLSPVKAVFVYIDPLPVLIITNPKTVNDPSTVDITVPAVTAGSTPGLTYTYFSDSLGTIPMPDPKAISVPGTYYIRGTNGGGNSVLRKVIVTIDYIIFIPNIFTPNGDGKNDRFEIVRLQHYPGSSLMIYNRWGNTIYHSADYQNTWDGGGQVPGTYYYVLLLKKGGESVVYKGWVQILH